MKEYFEIEQNVTDNCQIGEVVNLTEVVRRNDIIDEVFY